MKNIIEQYYSENNLDKFIRENYFPDWSYEGVMVEVGGGLPDRISNSKHFRQNGWRTIVFEPNPDFYKLFLEQNIECYNYACSNLDQKNIDFSICDNNSGLSFSALEIKYSSFNPSYMTLSNVKVDTVRLDTFFSEKNIQKIDFMTIDTEGWEMEVMSGFDPKKVDCKYIILENFQHDPMYDVKMFQMGYIKINQLNYDYIYEKTNLLKGNI
jgi:FkbM family methyltransferase